MAAWPGLPGTLRDRGPTPLPREAAPPGPAVSSRQTPGSAPARGRLSCQQVTLQRLAFPFIQKILPLDFFERDTLEVARDLLGKVLVREAGGRRLTGRLVEVEAYLGPEDLAAHSARGLTPRNQVMFGPAGHVYVFLIYGVWCCLNFVTRPAGIPQAVLIRALEPGPGVGRSSGPGLLCRSLAIDRSENGAPLRPPGIYLIDDGFRPPEVFMTPRIGVDYAGAWKEKPWRFCLDSPYLSRRLWPSA